MMCENCPRLCGADRQAGERGLCGADGEMRVARVMLHPWEEPCLCAAGAAGAVFFSGCSLGCVYCQNRSISRPDGAGLPGEVWDIARLGEEMLRLADAGASCIDLVTPTHYADSILAALESVRDRLSVPVVWNTGGYEREEIIRRCAGLVDVFLTDMKYGTPAAAARYSGAEDYPAVAAAALAVMAEVAGRARFAQNGQMLSGVILRHLVLPGGRRESEAALRLAAAAVDPTGVILSLMRQYTPDFAPESMPELRRRVTSFEYEYVRDVALRLGFDGYCQDKDSASRAYTPDF